MNPPAKTKTRGTFASLSVAIGIFLSRIAGLLRTRLMAHYLGNSDAAGAYTAAMKIPNFLQNLFGEGIMSASFIPVYANLRAEGRDREAVVVAETIGTLLGIVVTILAAVGILSSRLIIDILAPGFEGETRELTIFIVQVLFPGAALLVLSAWCLAVLNSHKEFLLAYTAPVLWNVTIIVCLILFGSGLAWPRSNQFELTRWVAWGTLLGCFFQFLVQLPRAVRLSQSLGFRFSLKMPEVRLVIRNFFPVVLSRGVIQVSAWIDSSIASLLGPAMVAAMGYAQQLYMLPISLFAMSISAAQLPELASIVGDKDVVNTAIRRKLLSSLERVSFFVIPSAVAFLVLGDIVTSTIFKTGQFADKETIEVWAILAGSTFGLVAQTQGRLISSTFYAIKETRVPLKFAIVRVSLTAGLGYLLAIQARRYFGWTEMLGAASLTATAGFAGWVEFLLLRRALFQRIGNVFVNRSYLLKLWGFALLGAVGAYGLKLILPPLHPILRGAVILSVFGTIYIGATAAFQVGESRSLLEKILKKIRR